MSHTKHSDTRNLEFGGVIGASLLVFVLPATILAINIACSEVFVILHTGSIELVIFVTSWSYL